MELNVLWETVLFWEAKHHRTHCKLLDSLHQVKVLLQQQCGNEESEWESAVDPDSGDTYYYNVKTGYTSWEIPDPAAVAEEKKRKKAEKKAKKKAKKAKKAEKKRKKAEKRAEKKRKKENPLPCIYCSAPGVTREHLVPKSVGGRCTFPCCLACNRERGNKLPAQFPPLLHYIRTKKGATHWEIAKQRVKNKQKLERWLNGNETQGAL